MNHAPGDELELTLHGFSPDGRGVGRTDEGLTVFVQGGLAGQRVRARLTSVKKCMAEAEAAAVLEASPEERPAPCPHAAHCGGCPWQRLPLPLQHTWKRRIVHDALTRIGRLNVPEALVQPVLSTGQEWGWRNKMEFAFAADSAGKTLLGLRARASHAVVEVTGCLLQTPRTMAVLQALRELCRKAGLSAAPEANRTATRSSARPGAILRFAVLREPRRGGCLAELITLPAPQEAQKVRQVGEALLSGPWGVTGFVHSTRAAPSSVASGERTALVLGESTLTETLFLQGREVAFRLGHNSFFQVNSQAAELLYETAAQEAARLFPSAPGTLWGKSCWDIYCGVGGLALTLAPHFESVSGLEIATPAVALASANAAALRENTVFRFETGDAAALERWFQRFGTPELLVTDPPRSGMDSRTVQALLTFRPPRLLLVSCNPATLARDLARISSAYELRSVRPVDLFPQTPHVETVVCLSRGEG
ncbi:23S rRNA (uracil(1939)-C(5))-methyltransferase RlmD [uncultured Mailhella sp.]|uniref:23S rRNA (uracil(1939)-C(5))-methyltransferase RlmD n=1 Tax=uncultured Mailhella sp. TaxID=1981031 RepID=UPI00261C00BE|nr:23S rRNA (uracil(1939)-C(5))-methyltransferase RlmD [uncultured Mailhella sp.]